MIEDTSAYLNNQVIGLESTPFNTDSGIVDSADGYQNTNQSLLAEQSLEDTNLAAFSTPKAAVDGHHLLTSSSLIDDAIAEIKLTDLTASSRLDSLTG